MVLIPNKNCLKDEMFSYFIFMMKPDPNNNRKMNQFELICFVINYLQMKRFFPLLIVFNLVLITGCYRNSKEELSAYEQANVYLNGTLLNLTNYEINAIVRQTEDILASGEDINSKYVTPELITRIRQNEQFIEVNFSHPRLIITDKSGKIEVSQLLIPLSGQFVSSGQLTIFYGLSSNKQQAFICSKGYSQLRELLIGMELSLT
jgi:hypothetical protein